MYSKILRGRLVRVLMRGPLMSCSFSDAAVVGTSNTIIRKVINTDKAPAASGPYSHAIQVGKTLYVSGQTGRDPTTGDLVSEDVEAQAIQTLENMGAILAEAGCTFNNVVKASVLLADINDFAKVNEIYSQFFTFEAVPARATFQVAALPRLARVEIEAVAIVGEIEDQ